MKKTILALGAITAAAGAAAYALNNWVYKALIHPSYQVPEFLGKAVSESQADDYTSLSDEGRQWIKAHGYDIHRIKNADGNLITAYHLKPKKKSNVYVFASHGYRSDGMGEWCFYARNYVETMGYNLFIVDHQGAGQSWGDYIGFGSFESRDGLLWLDYMNETFGKKIKIILHGISMGSATVMLMTGSHSLPENVRFTIADCGYTSALDEFTYKLESLGMPTKPIIPMVCKMNKKRAGYDFGKDTNALAAVENAKIPMLFIHGGDDKFVPTFMVHRLFDASSAPYKEKVIFPGADHAESYQKNKTEYEKKIKEFADKFLK